MALEKQQLQRLGAILWLASGSDAEVLCDCRSNKLQRSWSVAGVQECCRSFCKSQEAAFAAMWMQERSVAPEK